MPPKRKAQASKKLKQTTLFDAISSSPPKSPHLPGFSPSKIHSSPTKKRKLQDSTVSTLIYSDGDDSSDVADIKFAPKAPVEITDSDENPDSAPRRAMRKRIIHILDSDSDDNEQVGSTKERKKRVSSSPLDVTDDDEIKPLIKRRHLLKGKRPSRATAGEDSDDEVNEEHILDTRLRSRGKQTAFQKNLEKLKRRKEGKPAEVSDSENSSGEEGSGDSESSPFKGAAPSTDRDSLFEESSEDSDVNNFIVEDEEGTAAAVLPTEFSMETHQDLAHQFKKIFQFFVHIAVRSPQERREFMQRQMREEEYFFVPLRITRRKISGLRDSLVASSVWRPEFKKALEKFPIFELVPLDFAIPYCDACHLGGRMSTLIGRVSGSPYDQFGFEETQEDSDSDASSVSERLESKRDFHLGRFCAKRTRVYHEFSHWEHSVFTCIRHEVEELHKSANSKSKDKFFRVAYAGGKQPPEDLSDADGICEWLDERRIVDMEWQRIKAMMESARHLEMASKRGEVD